LHFITSEVAGVFWFTDTTSIVEEFIIAVHTKTHSEVPPTKRSPTLILFAVVGVFSEVRAFVIINFGKIGSSVVLD